MLRKEFEMWPVDPISNTTLFLIDIHVINLGYLEDRSSYFTKLLDDSMRELNKLLVRLNTAVIISDNNNQHLMILIDSEAEQKNKMKEKTKKC